MNDKRFDASKANRLDDPARLIWLPPAEVIGALAVQTVDAIADIGAGTGYFSLPLAQATGEGGRVYAVDAQADMLTLLQKKLNAGAISNIDLVRAEAEATGLPDASCHLVFLANVWHEFADRGAVLHEAKRILKPGGKIAVLDWRPDVAPPPGPPIDHRLSVSSAEDSLPTAGFAQIARRNIGKYSWFVQGILPNMGQLIE